MDDLVYTHKPQRHNNINALRNDIADHIFNVIPRKVFNYMANLTRTQTFLGFENYNAFKAYQNNFLDNTDYTGLLYYQSLLASCVDTPQYILTSKLESTRILGLVFTPHREQHLFITADALQQQQNADLSDVSSVSDHTSAQSEEYGEFQETDGESDNRSSVYSDYGGD